MASASNTSSDHVIESLQFPEVRKDSAFSYGMDELVAGDSSSMPEGIVGCFLCQQKIEVAESLDAFHQHLLEVHQLVIKEVHLICDFKRYSHRYSPEHKPLQQDKTKHTVQTNP